MGLSSDLISQFVKITNDTKTVQKDTVVYGYIKEYNGGKYVQLDGSDMMTPYESTTEVNVGDRVAITIKNHTATVTGNHSSPSVGTGTATEIATTADELILQKLEATNATIEKVKAESISVEQLNATNAEIDTLKITKADIDGVKAAYATIESLNAANAVITQLSTDKADIEYVEAHYANIEFTNIDFANIDKSIFKEFYANSGIIEDVIVNDQQITGTLVGVTVKGDLIEGGTVVADKLVIRGEDGLYYKLNTDGMTVEAEQNEYNSLDGSIITAKSITATKVSVSDLVAFDATIGGFNITENSLYSGVKDSINNALPGLYLDNEGQMYLGDENNYLKYYKDENGNHKLDISADSIVFGVQQHTIDDLQEENEKLREKLSQYEKYFSFTENGFSISDAGGQNRAELLLDSGIISFKKNGETYGWWDGVDFHTGNIVVEVNERAQFGNFAFIPRSDGSLSFLKVSGEDAIHEPITPESPVISNIFNMDMVHVEENVISFTKIDDTSAKVTVSSADESALAIDLDPSKTYRIYYEGINGLFAVFTDEWTDYFICDNIAYTEFSGRRYGYFRIDSFETSDTYIIRNVVLEEVT